MSEHARKVWIIDDDSSIRWVLGRALSKEELDIESFDTADNFHNLARDLTLTGSVVSH